MVQPVAPEALEIGQKRVLAEPHREALDARPNPLAFAQASHRPAMSALYAS